MTNPEEAAVPLKNELSGSGLSKREYYAGLAMQGLLARPNVGPSWSDEDSKQKSLCSLASIYIDMADALIQELNKPKETEKP